MDGHTHTVVRAMGARPRVRRLAWALTLSLSAWGCGRFGVVLTLRPEHASRDASGPDAAYGGMVTDEDSGSDACPDDPAKTEPGACGCGVSDMDADHDGKPDCQSTCDDATYVPDASCGVGYCRSTNTPASCTSACRPGSPLHADDATCDDVDDDCDGSSDEDVLAAASSCGQGVCAASGQLTCVAGQLRDSCVPGSPSALDGPTANGADDDCDGSVDEDACDPTPRTFLAGVHDAISVPAHCTQVTVRLWGGAGASGQSASGSAGGHGGAGGYAQKSFSVSGSLAVWVGTGAAAGCNAGGVNAGTNVYNGGAGGSGNGADGAGGASYVGGDGAQPGLNRNGGHGYLGGGGGGASDDSTAAGGGGGAASAFFIDNVAQVIAGGGGGGGGAVSGSGNQGGAGGEGCGGDGALGASNRCGGGGGGGACYADSVMSGSAGTPANASMLPAGQAAGGTGNCAAGGDGYAILIFEP